MKNILFRRLAALLLAMTIGLCPVLAQAEGFTPGDTLPTLLAENIAAGREITVTLGMDVEKLAVEGMDVQALSALLRAMEIQARYYDDFGTACVNLSLRLSGQEIADVDARIEEDNTVILTTSLVPDQTLVVPGEWLAEQMGAQDRPAVQALMEYMPMVYLTYFYRVGGWVSNVQMEREDLYVSVDDEVAATQERDASPQAMHYRVYNDDFLELLESVTFYFRDTDEEFKRVLANALAALGVTRGQLRRVTDMLFTREDLNGPEHWITRTEYLSEEELAAPVTFEDVYYLATHMAFSVKTCQEEQIDGVTDFIVSEGEDYDTVGFDGTMPQMWKDFPFENGAFTYNRKTLEGEGVHHTAQGHMDLIRSGYAVDGDLDFFWAEKNPSDFTNTFDIGMDFVRESDAFGFDADVSDRLYLEEDMDIREWNATLRVYKDATVYTLVGEILSATQEIEGDFANETHIRMTLDELLDASVSVRMSSGEYTEVVMPEAQVNVETATQEEMDALQTELSSGLISALYTALSVMPQEALALLQ